MNPIVNCVAYCNGERVASVAIDQIAEVLAHNDRFIWIGLREPTPELLTQVQNVFGLHELAVEDALSAHQRPKIEQYGDSLFVVLRTAYMNSEQRSIELGETHMFLGAQYIVVVRHGASLPYVGVRARLEATPHLLRKGPGAALYALMDFVVDQYVPLVDALEQELQTLEEAIFSESFSRETPAQIYRLQGQLLQVKRVVSPLIDICNRLTRVDYNILAEETQPYFRDVYDHVVRINEMVDTQRELLTTALEANLSLMSIAQNDVMKRFAGWGAIIALPTMIAGIYGMNFAVMPELNWPYSYPLVLALTLIFCTFLYLRFRRTNWL
ncbi:MAG: magnesium/cobalt transporter CorA [Chloroflexales bacterium]|nr:magnesium/cobalt transporter CorA [Chloroflexales bacterium]